MNSYKVAIYRAVVYSMAQCRYDFYKVQCVYILYFFVVVVAVVFSFIGGCVHLVHKPTRQCIISLFVCLLVEAKFSTAKQIQKE